MPNPNRTVMDYLTREATVSKEESCGVKEPMKQEGEGDWKRTPGQDTTAAVNEVQLLHVAREHMASAPQAPPTQSAPPPSMTTPVTFTPPAPFISNFHSFRHLRISDPQRESRRQLKSITIPTPQKLSGPATTKTSIRCQTLPIFTGAPTKDPIAFVEECTVLITCYSVLEEEWADCEFQQAFQNSFGYVVTTLRTKTKFTMEEQTTHESLTAFINRKVQVMCRFYPELPEQETLEFVADTARPEYREALIPLLNGI
ncbi:hypothetical protein PR048_023662 [Dryococelus australis]|uniref:Uncharacterized protein n=1 Tax=Dryococelus australis TaxID=614101 RepID=A0ABQ9GUT5_9NEOP|nr:hypothetical protein PR048_023662 [Dryococelus australis]